MSIFAHCISIMEEGSQVEAETQRLNNFDEIEKENNENTMRI